VGSTSAGTLAKTAGRTHQSKEDYPRRKHEYRENGRDECWGRLLFRAESVFDPRLQMVMDFLWVRDNGLRSGDDEIKEVNREGFVYE
jgi:hypothetical protein